MNVFDADGCGGAVGHDGLVLDVNLNAAVLSAQPSASSTQICPSHDTVHTTPAFPVPGVSDVVY